jgi:hypothetical protein
VKTFIFTALLCEAKPLIAALGLKKDLAIKPFAVYRNEQYCLTITGVGKVAMAAGVAHTLGYINYTANPVLLNVGVAGHQSLALGQPLIAEKIIDADSGKNFYPQLVYDSPCKTGVLSSVAKPQTDYPEAHIYDMEGSAFYETAIKFSSAELVQCLKIISDNQASSVEMINAKQVSKLIEPNVGFFEQLLNNMLQLSLIQDDPEPQHLQLMLSQRHFTVNEQVRLKKLLIRWEALSESQLLKIEASGFDSSRAFLNYLEEHVSSCDFTL